MWQGIAVPKLTVLIATRNREASLVRALDSLQRTQPPPGWEVEILVSDNGSTPPLDHLASQKGTYPVRVVREERPGKSRALNRGLQECRDSEVVAFTDDDMEFSPEWLVEALRHLERCDCAGHHGAIRVKLASAPPSWFTRACEQLFGGTADAPDGSSVRGLPGGNSFVRRAAIERAGPFREDLGPAGRRAGYSEDMEWSGRLVQMGERLCYCPAALNYHMIEETRMEKRYLLHRQFLYGRTEMLLDAQLPVAQRRWQDRELWPQLRGLLGSLVRPKGKFEGLDYWLEIANRCGHVAGLLRRRWGR